MIKHLGRDLRKGETIHHRNGLRNDNRIDNLEIWSRGHGPGQRLDDQLYWAVDLIVHNSSFVSRQQLDKLLSI